MFRNLKQTDRLVTVAEGLYNCQNPADLEVVPVLGHQRLLGFFCVLFFFLSSRLVEDSAVGERSEVRQVWGPSHPTKV